MRLIILVRMNGPAEMGYMVSNQYRPLYKQSGIHVNMCLYIIKA